MHQTDQEANLNMFFKCLTCDFDVDRKILQYAPDLTVTMIEDRVRVACLELDAGGRGWIAQHMSMSPLVEVVKVDREISPPPNTTWAAEVNRREVVLDTGEPNSCLLYTSDAADE